MNMSNCTITEHKLLSDITYFSAAVHIEDSVATLTNITIANNSIKALYATYSDLTINEQTIFTNNTSLVQKATGGNTSLVQKATGGAILTDSSTITFEKLSTTEISGNKADFGGGMYLQDSTLTVHGIMQITENTALTSGGGIFAYRSAIYGMTYSNIYISNNVAKSVDGGGIYLAASSLNIDYSNISISGNHAANFGGGIFFTYNSKITVKCKVLLQDRNLAKSPYSYLHYFRLSIKSNSALKGGGVYVADKTNNQQVCVGTADSEQTSSEVWCFIQDTCVQNNWMHYKSVLLEYYPKMKYVYPTYFQKNTAVITGSDIYGGLLDRCHTHDTNIPFFFFSGIAYMKQIVFGLDWKSESNEHELFNHISSDPVKLCFCLDNIINCTFTPPTVYKKKGETFTLSLAAADQAGGLVNATLFSSVNLKGRQGGLKVGQQSRILSTKCTELEYNVYYEKSEAVLELYSDGPCENQGLSKREVNIIFSPCSCPMGFEQLNNLNCSCDCTEKLKAYIKQCWQDEGTFQLNDNNWIENINDTGYTVHECLFDYCVNEPINISLSEPSDIQCAFNRTGILCGKCAQGLSMVFANSQCRPCSNYYLFLLLPFGLAGIALVAFILFLNITVATGTIHGLIFYANIITANRSIFLPFGTPNVLIIFISWLNLDLGIEACFYDGMDSYRKLMLQLVFPAYVFFLIATIMVLCDRSQRIAHLFGKRNPEATLYTLFLLSYSKLIRTIITALQYATLNYPDGSQEIVWLYDANVKYFAINHIPRFLAAFLITILGAVYTSLLLFGQLFNRCSEYRLMKWTSHKYYIHFLKAHHAPLSDKHRYWVGLLLLARLTHYLISAFANDFVVVLLMLIMTLFLLVHKAIFNSYSKKFLNLLEIFFITNLSILAGATLFVRVSVGDQQVLTTISMSISFIAFLGIVLYHILDSCGVSIKKIATNILLFNRKRRDVDYRPVALIELNEENGEDDHESDEELIDIANALEDTATNEPYDPSHYITPPIIRSALPHDQLREPALDELCPLTPADYNPQPARHRIRQIRQAPPTVSEIVVRK